MRDLPLGPGLLAALVGLAAMPSPSMAAMSQLAVASGTYSSLAYHEESGDLLGYEVEVIPTVAGTRLVLQVAEGGVADVVVAEATQSNGTLEASFDLSRNKGCRLTARAKGSNLVVTFDFGNGIKDTATLARSVSYWDRKLAIP